MRNERPVEEERPPSNAASELVLLRQRHTVSGLRYLIIYSFCTSLNGISHGCMYRTKILVLDQFV